MSYPRKRGNLTRVLSGALAALLVGSTLVAVTPAPSAQAAITNVNPFAATKGFTVLAQGNANLSNSEIEGSVAAFGSFGTNSPRYPMVQQVAGIGSFSVPTIDGRPVRLLAGSLASGANSILDIANSGAVAGTPEAQATAKLVSTTGLSTNNQGFLRVIGPSPSAFMELKAAPFASTTLADVKTTQSSVGAYFPELASDIVKYNQCFADISVGSPLVNYVTVTNKNGMIYPSGFSTTKPNVVNYESLTGATIKMDDAGGYIPTAAAPLIIRVAASTTTLGELNFGWDTGSGGQQSYSRFMLADLSRSTGTITVGNFQLGSIWAPGASLNFAADRPTNGQWLAQNITTSGAGEVHHHAFGGSIPCDVKPPTTPYDLALRKTVVSTSERLASGTVTFRLEVANQTADSVNGVTITDYIDTASFLPMTTVPAPGVTTGAVARAYTWSNASTTAPTLTIAGEIPGRSSVFVDVTLQVANPVRMEGLRNWAEITRFDNDGNPTNGDSSTGVVYDVDSIPDANRTNDALVDDDVDQHAWTNNGTTTVPSPSATDEDDHDVAIVPIFDLALIKTRSAGQSATVTTSSTTASFDVTVKNQGSTPVFNVKVLDSPAGPLTRSALTPASQTVTSTQNNSVVVSYDTTSGVFTIPSLAAGDTVRFSALAVPALVNTVQVNTAEIAGFDNNADATDTKPVWVRDVDSTPDTTPGNDPREVFPGSTFPEDSHNQIDRTPVNGLNAADEDDHDSEAIQLGLLRLGSTVYIDANGDDVGQQGEVVPGVLVQLFRLNGSAWDPAGSAVTNAAGDYVFEGLFPGTYQVAVPSSQSGPSGVVPTALDGVEPVSSPTSPTEDVNADNDGAAKSGYLSRTGNVTLTYNGEPIGSDSVDEARIGPAYADVNSNLNVDFVFEPYTYELGNLVWSDSGAGDHYNNGVADADEAGLDGVEVELYRDANGDTVLDASEFVDAQVTAGGGFYTFTGLAPGSDYVVAIVKDSVPVGYAPSAVSASIASAPTADNDNNTRIVLADSWSSDAVTVGPGATSEPVGERDGTTGALAQPTPSVADNRADQTVDFGFVPSVRIGNQVWRDESDSVPTTQELTDNDGIFNGAEVGLGGVRVELWIDVDSDGDFEPGADDAGPAYRFTSTDAEGNYWFDGVRPGIQYFVVIPSIASHSLLGPSPVSSTGQSMAAIAGDNDDDGAPLSVGGVDYLAVSVPVLPTLGGDAEGDESDADEPGVGTAEAEANVRFGAVQYRDADSQLRVDFGFVNVPVYRLGNLVWLDNGGTPSVPLDEANGVADPNEPGIQGLRVELFAASDATFASMLGFAVTDANGEYAFENLVAGDYVVRIPAAAGANASKLAGLTSTVDGVIANVDYDNDDNGVVASGGWVSSVVTLNARNAYQGGEPELEARRATEPGTYDTGLSWTPGTTDPATYANNRSNLTVDFGFTKTYRIGNLVWHDTDNDGVAEAGEPGIDGVRVQLIDDMGAVKAETTTSGGGTYVFTGLPAGDYTVRIPAGPNTGVLGGYASSSVVEADANADDDNDNNGVAVGGSGWESGVVTLGGTEPTDERDREGGAADDGPDPLENAASNYTVDFGFWSQMRIGNVVWIDQDNDATTHVATDNNGAVDPGETLVENAQVTVWLDGGDKAFDAGEGSGDDTLAGSDVTDAEGNWLVTGLAPGTYFAAIEALPTPYGTYVTSLSQEAAGSVADNTDNGGVGQDGAGNDYAAVSHPIVLAAGAAPSLEQDALPTGDVAAEAEATGAGRAVRDTDSNLTIDLSFVSPPLYRIGNLVWLDTDADGIADAGESGIGGVYVELVRGGSVVGTTVTTASGYYAFEGLQAGSYSVRIPQTQPALVPGVDADALKGLAASVVGSAGDTDNDSNGVVSSSAWESDPIILGGRTDTFESEPVDEFDRATGARDDSGWSVGTDGRSNFAVDFGFHSGLRLGDTVWFDDGKTATGAIDYALENDGVYQASEDPAAGVVVQLYAGNTSGSPIQTAVTDAEGEYFFVGLDDHTTYYVAIPASEQGAGEPLRGFRASTPVVADGAGTNDLNHGVVAPGFAAVSGPITLVRAGMAYADAADEPNADAKSLETLADGDSNLVVDFGFSPAPLYQLGNLVWLDDNDNGRADAGEQGLGGVTVALYSQGAGGALTWVGNAVTDAAGPTRGRFQFADLEAGTYVVRVPVQAVLSDMVTSGIPTTDANDDVDNDNNGVATGVTGWTSGPIELGAVGTAGEDDEPLGERDFVSGASAENGSQADGRSNQTVDFGFAQRARIGNQVWRDESDSLPSTHAATDNNGRLDAGSGELGIGGVAVELWRDVNGDGIQWGVDDVKVDTTSTDAEGNYWFDAVAPGDGYFVAVRAVGSPLSEARSSTGQSAGAFANDNDDDGAPLGAYLSVSAIFSVELGDARTGERDAVEPDAATEPSAEAEANAATGTYVDANSALDVDFGFVDVPLYRLGNTVWLDENNDGVADSTEDPIAGVLVQLLTPAGVVAAETVTDANGEYVFANLVAGEYAVRIPAVQVPTLGGSLVVNAAALTNLASSTTDGGDPDSSPSDRDDNGITTAGGWQSGLVSLGSLSGSPSETEPTLEADFRAGVLEDTGWTYGTDARSNLTVDFGFYELMRLGDVVWLDNGGFGAAYVPAHEDNGVLDAGEQTLDGVAVRLFRDGGNGVFDASDVPAGTTTTVNGTYFFAGLTEGTYFVAIPGTELAADATLDGLKSSTGRAATDTVNDLDQGEPEQGWAAVSRAITMTAGAMSNGDTADEARANTRTGVTVSDASSHLAIDFGFSPIPTYALGNLVWEDANNNGVADPGENGIGDIEVRVYADVNGNGTFDAADTLVRTTTTATGSEVGRYVVEDLPAGEYIVRVPSQPALSGWLVGGTPTAVADAGNALVADNDNNAVRDATNGGWTAGAVTLGGPAGPADNDEPAGEADGIDGADAQATVLTRDDRSNLTVDFGFWRGIRVGNQVWLDEGAGSHQDNGVYDADETPLTGVAVELWVDDGDGVFEPGAGDVASASTTTGGEGRYFFEGLAPGQYFVAIPAGPAGEVSSTGASAAALAADGVDDGAPAPGYVAVSSPLSLTATGAALGETDGPGTTTDDAEAYANGVTGAYADRASYLTVDFGLREVPAYRVGNLVWFDANNDGIAQTSEPGLNGVLVQLTDASGAVLAETVTSGGGKYAFSGIAAGDYRVQIPSAQTPVVDPALAASITPGAIVGYTPSTAVDSSAENGEDGDANGIEVEGGSRSGIITVGNGESVSETLRADSALDDDTGSASPRIDDNRSDFTVDFGYYSISLGNLVFFDANGDGVYDPNDGDYGVAGVPVNLRTASGVLAGSTVTTSNGAYLFTGLREGDQYYVEIPTAAFVAGGALNGYFSSIGDAGSTGLNAVDGPDRGVDPATPYGAVRSSGLITASSAVSPLDDGEDDNPDNDAIRPDAAENLIVDFGFYRMELGGTVFLDQDNDGRDGNDGDFSGVTVLLYRGDGTPYLLPSGAQASAVTDASGNYRFSGLPAGEYILEIPASEFTQELLGYANSDGNNPTPPVENNVTGEDNGTPVSGDVFSGSALRSTVLVLSPAGEVDSDPAPTSGYRSYMSNLTVDFGFWHAQVGLELGNQVWIDSNKDGLLNFGESTAPAGVVLWLLDGQSGARLGETTTDSAGRYLFTGLAAGDYRVQLPPSDFVKGGPLEGYMATDGAGRSADPNDGNDSDSNALPLSVSGIRSGLVTLRAAAPVNEADLASGGLDDRQSDLTVDFGLILNTTPVFSGPDGGVPTRTPLAFTGSDVDVPLRQAVVLVGLGLLLLIASRRRRDA